MSAKRDIMVKRLTLVACIYFMLLGLFDIGMDIRHGTLSWFQTIFNLAFFIPILFRRQAIHLLTGIVFSLLWGYLLFGGLITMSLVQNIDQIKQYGISAFLLASLACSLMLVWSGIHISTPDTPPKLQYSDT